jgi:hypothetical protein
MRRLLLGLIAAGILLCGFASSAAGMQIYHTASAPNPAEVHFACGATCWNDFEIQPGSSVARGRTGGHFWLTNVGGFTGQDNKACELGTHSLSTIGWAELHYNGGYNWLIYGNDGNPVSGSPFPVVFSEYQATRGCGG